MPETPSSSVLTPPGGVVNAGLTARLRQAIAADHLAIEALPLSQALVDGTVRLEGYLDLLHDLAPLHAAIEARVDGDGVLKEIFEGPLIRRHAALAADLVWWDAVHAPPSATADRLAAWVTGCSAGEAVGACYVVAGSCLGAAVLAPGLAKAFHVTCGVGTGLDYQFIPPPILGAAWRQVKERLAAWGATHERADAARDGARAMMRGLCTVYAGRAP